MTNFKYKDLTGHIVNKINMDGSINEEYLNILANLVSKAYRENRYVGIVLYKGILRYRTPDRVDLETFNLVTDRNDYFDTITNIDVESYPDYTSKQGFNLDTWVDVVKDEQLLKHSPYLYLTRVLMNALIYYHHEWSTLPEVFLVKIDDNYSPLFVYGSVVQFVSLISKNRFLSDHSTMKKLEPERIFTDYSELMSSMHEDVITGQIEESTLKPFNKTFKTTIKSMSSTTKSPLKEHIKKFINSTLVKELFNA